MGYTRGIIRRGFRAEDQQVPQISPSDMLRIMGDPSPDENVMNLPPNAKRTRYAWLLHGEKPVKKTKKPRKKDAPDSEPVQESADAGGPVDPAITQAATEQVPQSETPHPHPSMPSNEYPPPPMYISPYRQATESGGLVISGDGLESNRDMSQQLSPEGSSSISIPSHA